MTTVQKTLLFLIIIITPSLYLLLTTQDTEKKEKLIQEKVINSKRVEIEPIKIPAIEVKKEAKKPDELLSQLKIATRESKVGIGEDKEEVSKLVLNALKEKIVAQEIQRVETISIIKPTKEQKVEPKVVLKKKSERKKVTKNRHVTKQKKVAKREKVQKVAVKTKAPHKTKKILNKEVDSFLAKITISKKRQHTLTREEEVALYESRYASSLEVVGVSKPFEIKEKSTTPDAHYFEPIKVEKKENPNAPLKFVKKLGVVAVSNKYETNFAVPPKKELAKEGVVTIPRATVETEELKKLKFVKPLEVVEISKVFETIEADKYLN